MKMGHKISKIISVDADSLSVHLVFTDGHRGVVSLSPVFKTPRGLSAEILRGGMFEHCFVEGGALAWPNGFELCPDTLRQWMTEQKTPGKTKAA